MLRGPLFHAIDPTDLVLRHNLYCGKGLLIAISLMRCFDLRLHGIVSPYEAFTRECSKEELFERIRVTEYPEQPPRMGSVFLLPTREQAEFCNAEWWDGNRVVLEAWIVEALSAGVFDSRQLDAAGDQWETAARRYWAGESTPESRPEVVVCGKVQLIGWERYAKPLGP